MKYFVVEGTLNSAAPISDDIMKKHIAYSQNAIDKGIILVSGLKEDMSGGLFIIKAESLEKVQDYLTNEPFKVNGIQEYKIIQFTPHNSATNYGEWFRK